MRSLILTTRTTRQSTPRTRIILAGLDGHSFEFHAGQAVFAGLADGQLRRPYSIACSPGQAKRTAALELLVQIDDHAAPDPHLERATPGTLLRIDGPIGSFELPSPLVERHVLLVAGGTGIAPLRSIMWDVLEHQPEVDISVIYSARAPEELAYLDELSTLAAGDELDLFVTVTRESGPSWSGATGRIDRALLGRALKTADTRCLVCGPAGFVAGVVDLLKDAGVEGEKILRETHSP